jgi:hypothetical protein
MTGGERVDLVDDLSTVQRRAPWPVGYGNPPLGEPAVVVVGQVQAWAKSMPSTSPADAVAVLELVDRVLAGEGELAMDRQSSGYGLPWNGWPSGTRT